jgi:hypothetical protein
MISSPVHPLSLSAPVFPREHIPLWIEQDNRIIDHGIDKQLEKIRHLPLFSGWHTIFLNRFGRLIARSYR